MRERWERWREWFAALGANARLASIAAKPLLCLMWSARPIR